MPKVADIDSANFPHIENIKQLKAWWMCHKKPGCTSEHCWVDPADASHIRLGHAQIDVWAAALVCIHLIFNYFVLLLIGAYSSRMMGLRPSINPHTIIFSMHYQIMHLASKLPFLNADYKTRARKPHLQLPLRQFISMSVPTPSVCFRTQLLHQAHHLLNPEHSLQLCYSRLTECLAHT